MHRRLPTVLALLLAGCSCEGPLDTDAGADAPGGAVDGGADDVGGGLDAPTDTMADDGGAGDDVGSTDDGGAPDGSAFDGGGEDVGVDGGTIAACSPALAPEVGARTPTSDRTAPRHEGDFAVDPCTGDVGFAWVEEVAGDSTNREVWFRVLPAAAGGALGAPVRLTAAPGPAFEPRVVWAGDRYVVLWIDQRHDLRPDTCTSHCRMELYFAALDPSGTVVVAERRLTDKPDMMLHLAASSRADGRVAAVWVDRRSSTEIWAALIEPDGTLALDLQANDAATGTEAYDPSIQWSSADEWVITYSDRPGSDYVYVRTMDDDGTLRAARNVMSGSRPRLAERADGTWALLAQASSQLSFLDAGFDFVTMLASGGATNYDGTWALGWLGDRLFLTSSDFSGGSYRTTLVETNALGVRVDTHVLFTPPVGVIEGASDVALEVVGDRIVVEWHASQHHLVVIEP